MHNYTPSEKVLYETPAENSLLRFEALKKSLLERHKLKLTAMFETVSSYISFKR